LRGRRTDFSESSTTVTVTSTPEALTPVVRSRNRLRLIIGISNVESSPSAITLLKSCDPRSSSIYVSLNAVIGSARMALTVMSSSELQDPTSSVMRLSIDRSIGDVWVSHPASIPIGDPAPQRSFSLTNPSFDEAQISCVHRGQAFDVRVVEVTSWFYGTSQPRPLPSKCPARRRLRPENGERRPDPVPQGLTPSPLSLIDEYKFLVHPRIAGHGPTLYQSGLPGTRRLELVSAKPLRNDAVAMHYRRAGVGSSQ